jgi:hypothetical protein
MMDILFIISEVKFIISRFFGKKSQGSRPGSGIFPSLLSLFTTSRTHRSRQPPHHRGSRIIILYKFIIIAWLYECYSTVRPYR